MKAVLELLSEHASEIMMIEIAAFAAVMITFQIKRLKVLRKMNETMNYITSKLKAYFQTILDEEDETGKNRLPASKQETDMRKSLENRKKKQEEAIIDAVLQEIFP